MIINSKCLSRDTTLDTSVPSPHPSLVDDEDLHFCGEGINTGGQHL